MQNCQDYLFELGCEELPPKALSHLGRSFLANVKAELLSSNLEYSSVEWFATPRRLAIIIHQLSTAQPTTTIVRKGPSIKAAFDSKGNPTKAALGFAKSCKTDISQLKTITEGKNSWLGFDIIEQGQQTKVLLPIIIEKALKNLPVAKRMRWGKESASFVRPIHWIASIWGKEHLPLNLYGVTSGQLTWGHRVHCPQPQKIDNIDQYTIILNDVCKIIPQFEQRKTLIRHQITQIADQLNSTPIIDDDLLEEVTSLTEWPIAIYGKFDDEFLNIPQEALIASMQEHQKYFPLVDKHHHLMPFFITITNLESRDQTQIIAGNEKVIRPRLADAQFFFNQDKKTPLAEYNNRLKKVIFQKKLGTVFEKSLRISKLCSWLAETLEWNKDAALTAGLLSKADLPTLMVNEFPDLQGTMGKYYFSADTTERPFSADEKKCIAAALEEQYWPRFSGDRLPETKEGIILSLADRMDTLVGIFGINQLPTGDKDPFGLRRASISILRIIIEKKLDIDLSQFIEFAISNFKDQTLENSNTFGALSDFFFSRYRTFYQSQSITTDVIQAVEARQPTRPYDFDSRINAVNVFKTSSEAVSLAAANKRVSNILKKSDNLSIQALDPTILETSEEKTLYDAICQAETFLPTVLEKQSYHSALTHLSQIRKPVDQFFDNVMVNVEDERVRMNRLSILKRLRELFLPIADISLLKIE